MNVAIDLDPTGLSPEDFLEQVNRDLQRRAARDKTQPGDPVMVAFSTDGCSGGMSSSWKALFGTITPWEGCCVEHDYAYWKGGPARLRAAADLKLRECVSKNGHPIIAWLMWAGVRFGGHPAWRTSYRWGYGCKYRMGYPQ